MDKMTCQMTVLFEGAFWVGIFEKTEGNRLSVAKVTFGAEPKDYEVRDFILTHFSELKFSPEVKTEVKERKQNPKRAQREAKKQLQRIGIGTKSQQALSLQHEENKQKRKEKSREQKRIEEERRFILKQAKKKEKHRGR